MVPSHLNYKRSCQLRAKIRQATLLEMKINLHLVTLRFYWTKGNTDKKRKKRKITTKLMRTSGDV